MSVGSIQITCQKLSSLEVDDICNSLTANRVRCLSLRECSTTKPLFEKLIMSLSSCKSILQLNLNLGLVKNYERTKLLCEALNKNRSLNSLFLHGSQFGQKGMKLLCKTLALHPNIVSLDIGDCDLTDASLSYLVELFPPNGAKRGLNDLTLSANSSVTSAAWTRFFISLAASNTLSRLYLDYTVLDETAVSCLAVALASCKSLKVLDLEGTGITDKSAQSLLYLVKNYPVPLTDIVLTNNDIEQGTVDAIHLCLQENADKRTAMNVVAQLLENESETDATSTAFESTLDTLTASSVTFDGETTSELSEDATMTSTMLSSKSNSSKTSNNKLLTTTGSKQSQPRSPSAQKQRFNVEIMSDTDDSEDGEDMGTLLVGETLPGFGNLIPIRVMPRRR